MEKYLNKIILGDCLEVMKQLPSESIDCVFSDIPYKISSGGCSTSSNFGLKHKWSNNPDKIALYKKGKLFEFSDLCPSFYLPELYRICKDKAHLYLMVNHSYLHTILDELHKSKFILNNILVMQKNNCLTNQWYMKDIEFTVFFRKGGAKPLNNFSIKSCQQVVMPLAEEKIHQTQKPVDYVKLLVKNSTQKGDLVLDMFSGSGTTALACHDLGLDFICIEKDPDYHRLSVERLEQHKRQLKLF